MNRDIINQAIEASLVADAYALGAHWVYDEAQLKSLDVNWNELNSPQAMWHKGKEKGDFTHYGDHTKWLLEFIQENNHFNLQNYVRLWHDNMQMYTGYVDGSSRETLEALKENPHTNTGSSSHDLSIIGRISPLLLVSSIKSEFLSHVHDFVAFTHNSPLVLKAAEFFGSVLYDVSQGQSITTALNTQILDAELKTAFEVATASKDQDSVAAIRHFGPACSVEGGFEGAIHLLCTYDDYKEAMIANAKAGGDSAARAMIVGMIMGAAGCDLPASWKEETKGV